MNLNSHQRKYYKTKFISAAKLAVVTNGRWNIIILHDAIQPLYAEMLKNEELRGTITETEVLFAVYDILETLKDHLPKGVDFRLIDRVSTEEIDDAGEKFVKLIAGIPYEHFFYFQLPIELPDELPSISITENLEIVVPSEAEPDFVPKSNISKLVDALGGKISAPTKREVFCRIGVFGYGRGQTVGHTVLRLA